MGYGDNIVCRRNAVLSFLSKFPPQELRHFIYLLIRGIVPRDVLHTAAAKSVNMEWNTWYASTWVLIDGLPVENVGVAWERQMGFLYTIEQCIKVLGFGIQAEMENILMLISKLFQHAQCVRLEAQDVETEEGEDMSHRNVNKAQGIRTLCLQRFTGIMHEIGVM